jgi:hypothetical protein
LGNVTDAEIKKFLHQLSKLYLKPLKMYLLGGGALHFLGSSRRTADIDVTFETDFSRKDEIFNVIETLGNNMHMELEFVPIEEFIPLPKGVESRHQRVG